jgi:NitT/TauT family transport system substrate-binding protein
MLLALVACSPAPDATTGAATSSAVPAPAPKTLTVALNWYPEPEFGGFYEAVLAGTYAAAGLDVTILPGGPGAPVLELLASGKADVAISGADDLLIRRARGLDAVAVLPGFQDTPVGLMTHTASGVTRFEDVKGKVAIEAGSPFQQFLWGKFGWEGKVEPVPTTGSIGPFAADPTLIQQAFITSEPCVAEGQGLTITFLPGRDAGWNPYASLAVVRGADKDSAWVEAFHDASLQGWKSYLADPTRGNAEIGRLNPNLPMDRMGCIVARQKPFVEGTDGVGAMTAARWEQTAAALNSVGQKVDAAGAWVDLGG